MDVALEDAYQLVSKKNLEQIKGNFCTSFLEHLLGLCPFWEVFPSSMGRASNSLEPHNMEGEIAQEEANFAKISES